MMRPKFQPMDLVRVRTPDPDERLGSRPPGTLIMGKTGTISLRSSSTSVGWNRPSTRSR